MEYQDLNLNLACQQHRAWSDYMDVMTDLALYWWRWLITFSSSSLTSHNIMVVTILFFMISPPLDFPKSTLHPQLNINTP